MVNRLHVLNNIEKVPGGNAIQQGPSFSTYAPREGQAKVYAMPTTVRGFDTRTILHKIYRVLRFVGFRTPVPPSSYPSVREFKTEESVGRVVSNKSHTRFFFIRTLGSSFSLPFLIFPYIFSLRFFLFCFLFLFSNFLSKVVSRHNTYLIN